MTLTLLLAILHASGGSSLSGVVRSADSPSAPIVSALVEVSAGVAYDSALHIVTDSLGHYELSHLAPGTYHIRVSRIGYDARQLDVLVASAPRVVVDIMLAPRPQLLSELRVRAMSERDSARHQNVDPFSEADPGAAVVSGASLHSDPALADPDALQSLSARGLAASRDEAPTSIHVRGGGASENGFTIDGVPVFNPYHAIGTLTALDPDVIESVSLDRGAPSAAFGGATAASIGLSTTAANPDRIETRGGFNARSLRESAGGPLGIRSGTFLVAIRRSLDASLSDSHAGPIGGAKFGDLFAGVTMPVGGGELEAFAFHSADRLSFAAATEQDASDGAGGAPPESEHDDALSSSPGPAVNAAGWNTGTDAIRWRSDGDTRWEVRAWRTRFAADFAWAGSALLRNSLVDFGASASASWLWRGAHLSSGVTADHYDVRYNVTGIASPGVEPLALSGDPILVSAFGEARWTVATRWTVAAGVRDALSASARAGLEPRLSVGYSPNASFEFGVGYARLHQYVQSLRNEESIFDAIAGISLPVIAGSTFNGVDVPVARADQLTANADVRISPALTLSANAYARDVTGLVLAAPVTAQPFATTAFAVGGARARGISLLLSRESERMTSEIGYSLSSVRESAGGLSYTPSYGAAQSVSAAAGFRVRAGTVLRAALSVHGGAPTSVVADQIEWTPYTSSAGRGDLAGSPSHIVGALDGSRLPAYARFDIGVRHDWHLRFSGRDGQLTTSAGLTNLFDRGNALGISAAQTSNAFLLLPRRSVTVGLEWKY